MLFLNEKNNATSKLSIKGVKEFIGREGHGLICSLYFKNKRVLVFSDFADGSCEYSLDYCIGGKLADVFKKDFLSYVENSGIPELMLKDPQWNELFNNSVDNISFQSIINEIIEVKRLIIQDEKTIKKLKKLSLKSIVVSKKDSSSYYSYSWKKVNDLSDIMKATNGLSVLQKTYDKAKNELADDEYIVNDLSVLTSFGVVI